MKNIFRRSHYIYNILLYPEINIYLNNFNYFIISKYLIY